MDFVHLIKDQNSKINDTSPYLEALWTHLSKTSEYNLETTTLERKIFMDHLPLNLQSFLNDCQRKVEETISAKCSINFSGLNLKYLKSFLYWCLVCGDEQGQLVPLTTARLYFTLNSISQQSQQYLFVENIYSAAINALDAAVSSESIPAQAVSVINALRVLLKGNTLTKEAITHTLLVLNKIITLNGQEIFDRFNIDEPSHSLEHAALLCFKVLLMHLQENYDRNKEMILMTLFNLMGCFSSVQMRQKDRASVTALQTNVRRLLKGLYQYEIEAECPVLIVVKTLAVHKNFDQYDKMVSIICDLDYNVYASFCWWVIEGIISREAEFRMHLPNLAVPLIIYPHANLREEKKNALIEVLTLNLIKLCSDAKFEIAECAIGNLEAVVYLDDNSVKNAVNNLLSKDCEAILEMISKHITKNWKQKNTNRHFINVICKFYTYKRNILDTKLTKEIDEMFKEVTPTDLRPCMKNLADILKCASNKSQIVNIVLKFFVRMTLSTAAYSSFYAKMLYDVIFQSIEQNLDSSDSLSIANLLLSQQYEYKEVFKKFHSLHLLTPHKLNVLINYKATESPAALKLICVMLDFIDYKHFEGLENLTHITFQQKTYSDADMLFYALENILKKLSVPMDARDAQFLEEFLPILEYEVRIKNLPVSCSSNAISLMLKLEKLMHRDLQIHHIVTELETSLFNKLLKIEACEDIDMFEICRDLSYMGDLLLLTDETLGERTISLLRNILKINNDRAMAYLSRHPDIWSLLVVFFTKLSLKHEVFVEENILILETALLFENENVRYHALLAFEDLCSIRLNYYQPLVLHIFKFIQEENPSYLIIVSMRIIKKLINEDYILLDEQQYVALTSLLAHKNEYVRTKAESVLLECFLSKCKQTIAKFFVPSILYYNRYKHHPIIYMSDDAMIVTLSATQRRRIYQFLLESMAISAQFSVINEISNEILGKILDGSLIQCAEVLADCVSVIGVFLQGLGKDIDNKTQEKLLRAVVEKRKSSMETRHHQFEKLIKNFLIKLLNVAFQIHEVDGALRPELVKITIRVTAVLFAEINKIIMDGGENLRKLYLKFLSYYDKYKHTFPDDDENDDDDDATEIIVEFDCAGPSTSYS